MFAKDVKWKTENDPIRNKIEKGQSQHPNIVRTEYHGRNSCCWNGSAEYVYGPPGQGDRIQPFKRQRHKISLNLGHSLSLSLVLVVALLLVFVLLIVLVLVLVLVLVIDLVLALALVLVLGFVFG